MRCSTPTVVSALGHSPSRTQLLTVCSSQLPRGCAVLTNHNQVPPYACSFVFSIISSYVCDKYKNRGLMATFCALLAAAGYAIFLGAWCACPVTDAITSGPTYICLTSLASGNRARDYGALFLQIVGSYGIAPCLVTWQTNNVQPHYRRATAVAFGLAAVNVGGIVSTWLFTDAPRFHKATSVNLAVSLGMAMASIGLILYLRAQNARKRRNVLGLLQLDGQGTGDGGWDSPEERRRLGDRHPRFEYTI
jgi:hypothetical protein